MKEDIAAIIEGIEDIIEARVNEHLSKTRDYKSTLDFIIDKIKYSISSYPGKNINISP
jgi:hypothetical protein